MTNTTTRSAAAEQARENSINLIRAELAAPVEELAETLESAHRCTVFELDGYLWADIQKNFSAGVLTISIVNGHGYATFTGYCGDYAAVTIDLFSEDVAAIREAALYAGLLQSAELSCAF